MTAKIICIILAALALLVCVGYIAALIPSYKRKKKALAAASVRYAHRGLHDALSPENSMSAFEKAVDAGFGIELDVRLSKDGRLVVFHDDTLDRMTDATGEVNAKDYDELKALRLAGSDEGIPLFEDVLSMVGDRVPLLIEIKEGRGSLDVTRATAKALKSYTGTYIIESFNPFSLAEIRKIMPKDTVVGILSEHFTRSKEYRAPMYYALQTMALNFLSRPDFVAYNYAHTSFLPFRLARMLGYVRLAYTVRDAQTDERIRKKDFHGVIFEGYRPEKIFTGDEK